MTRHPLTLQHLVVQTPGMRRVSVERDIPFARHRSDTLRFDLYRPAEATQALLPAVIFVTGYSDSGTRESVGCEFKDWAAYVDWARLVASSGLIAITYSNEDPVGDVRALVEHVNDDAESLGIDRARLGIWSCSGNTATALSALQAPGAFVCAVLCYGYLADAEGRDDVARAAAQFGFVNATAGISVADLAEVPTLIVRAGRDDMPGLNASLDRFVAEALAANLPLSLMNYPSGVHAFDIADPTEEARMTVHAIVRFLTARLRA